MSNREEVQAVQQQIDFVLEEVTEVKVTLAAAEQADNQEKVRHLRSRLEQLEREENNLRELKNLLLTGQQGGEPPTCMTSTIENLTW